MRLNDKERTKYSKFRNVSDLRIQFLCEYRFYLQQKYGRKDTYAATAGSEIHSKITNLDFNVEKQSKLVPFIIIMIALILGYLWIVG